MLCKNINRIVVFVLAIALITLCFTGCNKEDDKSVDLSSSQTGSNSSSAGDKLPPASNADSSNSSGNTPDPNPDLPNPPEEKEYSAFRGDVTLPIDMDVLKQLKVNIVTPDRYTAWPMLGIAKAKPAPMG